MESTSSTDHDSKSRIDTVGAIPILIFYLLAIFLKMFGLDTAFVYEQPDLLLILNTIFLFGCPMFVVYIAAKGYLASGSTRLMTLESGVLSFAVGSLIAGFMLPWKGPNGVITLHNCSVLIAGLLHLFGAVSTLAGARMKQDVHGRVSRLFLVNSGILILMFLLTFGAVQEKLPVFFVQGQGPTLLRQIVLGTAIISFLISGFLFLKLYSNSRSRFFYWYAMALFLITIGLFCVFIQKSFGDPIGWLGRTAQYLAGLYLIATVFRGARELGLGVLRMDKVLAKLFHSRFEKLLEERTAQLLVVNDELCKENERRQQSEDLLRIEKAILSRTERIAHVGSWEWDIATDTVTWSDELFRIFQRDPQEGAPRLAEHQAFYLPDDMARLQKAVEAAVAEGTPYELELRAIRKDGMTRVCKVYGEAEKGQVGRAIRLFGSLQDITEQKQAEETLRESEKHYRTLVESIPGIVYEFSSKQGGVYYSSHTTEILGYSPEQLYAQPMLWHNSVHPDDLLCVNKIIHEITTFKPFCIEYRIQDAHGNWHWFEDRSTGYHIVNTDVIMEGLALDITERKKTEFMIKAATSDTQRFRKALDYVSTFIYMKDTQSRYAYANRSTLELFGCTEDELVGSDDTRFFPPDIVNRLREIDSRVFLGEQTIEEIDVTEAEGERRIYLEVKAPIYLEPENKTIWGLLGISTDITDRKRTEELLREAHRRLEEQTSQLSDIMHELNIILENAPIGISKIIDRKQVLVNRKTEEMFRYHKEELEFQTTRKLYPSEEAYEKFGQEAYPLLTQGLAFETEQELIRKDGVHIWVRYIGKAIEPQDMSKGTIWLLEDITKRKLAQAEKAQLEEQNRLLQKAESLGRMAGAIAHHFNNQLFTVMGNLEMVMDDQPLGVNSNESLVSAMKAARKASDVSRLMLTYLGQSPGKHVPIDLSETCRQSLTFLQTAAPRGMIIKANFPSSGPTILADVSQIQQVLTNLITNAWEAAVENNGTVDLTAKTFSHADIPSTKRFPIDWQPQEIVYACLEVADTGCGIGCKDIEKIFDPFYTTKFIGRGLGLPVVMGIVKAHGGGITVESEPGRGSTFRIFFPVSIEELSIQHDLSAISEAAKAEIF